MIHLEAGKNDDVMTQSFFSTLLAHIEGNPSIIGGFSLQSTNMAE